MTCRAARLFQDHFRMNPVFCCECGSAIPAVYCISETLGPHLCPTCVHSVVECGARQEKQMRWPMSGSLSPGLQHRSTWSLSRVRVPTPHTLQATEGA